LQVVLVTGTVGVGKPTVGFASADMAAAGGTTSALVDLDEMSRLWPAPPDDPFRETLVHASLGAVVRLPPWVLEQRLRIRHRGPESGGLAWHLGRAPDLVDVQSDLAVGTVDAV